MNAPSAGARADPRLHEIFEAAGAETRRRHCMIQVNATKRRGR
jgi:hypothetical protein